MKEQVTDISNIRQSMAEEMRLMRESINRQYAEITQLNRNIDAQDLQIRKKNEVIANLTQRLSKYENPGKNSDNSSIPPRRQSNDVLGLSPSGGSLVNWVNEARRNAQLIIEKIKEYIMLSSVVGFDESGCYYRYSCLKNQEG